MPHVALAIATASSVKSVLERCDNATELTEFYSSCDIARQPLGRQKSMTIFAICLQNDCKREENGDACPLWVISDQSIQRQFRPMSAVTPNSGQTRARLDCPLSAKSRHSKPQGILTVLRSTFVGDWSVLPPGLRHHIATPRTDASGHNRNCGRKKEAADWAASS